MAIPIGIDLGQAFLSVAAYRGDRVEIITDVRGRERIPIADMLGDQGSEAMKVDDVDQHGITTILRRLKSLAESYLGGLVEQAVITVPASYGDLQRQFTIDAGHRAGLAVLRLLNAPTAAGIAHWDDRPRYDSYLMFVLDVGARRADATLLEVSDGLFEVKSSVGNARLGEQVYGRRVHNHFTTTDQGEGHDLLLEACERLKLSLSKTESSQLESGLSVTRSEFEDICEEPLRSTMALISRTLDDARTTMNTVQEVVLVGGSSRMPKLQQLIANFFDRPLERIQYSDLGCVRGAALQAAALFDPFFPRLILVLDVVPDSMHIEVEAGSMIQLWPRNTTLPRQSTICMEVKSREYLPQYFKIFEGGFKSRQGVGAFDLAPLYLCLTDREAEIEVTAAIDLDGVVDASLVSRNKETGSEIVIQLGKYGLPVQGGNLLQKRHSPIDNTESEGSLETCVTSLTDASGSLTLRQCENSQAAIAQVDSHLSGGRERTEDEYEDQSDLNSGFGIITL